jgi:hypothetical protein
LASLFLKAKKPSLLPSVLQDWSFLPEPLRSLDPYDRLLSKVAFCNRYRDDEDDGAAKTNGHQGETNEGFSHGVEQSSTSIEMSESNDHHRL